MISSFLAVLLFFLSACFVLPCSASYSILEVAVTPLSDTYPPGISLNTSAALAIIPAGPTTFIEGYTLVLSTDLDQAWWNVRVMVDGRQAAVFQKFGTTVFINGYLLSYPVTRDVEVEVALNGAVPSPRTESTFSVLRAIELNNQGQVVPGSEESVTRTIDLPVTLRLIPSQSDPVAEDAGIPPVLVLGGIFLIFLCTRRRK